MENTFRFWRDDEGIMRWENAKTLDIYRSIGKEGAKVNFDNYNCFIAFGTEQFEKEYNKLKQRLGVDEVALISTGYGLFGTREGYERLTEYYNEQDKRIAQECDPQEAYCYEYNNYECAIDYDGDEGAMKKIILTFGLEKARSIVRRRDYYTIDEIEERMKKD